MRPTWLARRRPTALPDARSGEGRRPTRREAVRDGLLALALLLFGLVGTGYAGSFQGDPTPASQAYVLVAVAALVLAARRRWPLPTLAVAAAATSTYLFLGHPYGPILASVSVALYTVAVRLPTGRAAAVTGAVLLGLLAHLTVEPHDSLFALMPLVAWVVVPFALGATVRLSQEAIVRARDEQARRLVDEERLRIAQEVHDVVGHGLAAINMQAQIALHVLTKRPEQAATALTAISASSKEALDELRVTLGAVRRGDGQGEGREPAPGLAQVETLRIRMAGAGLQVTVQVTGTPRTLPAAVDLAAYRVVQESLTNVLRHAGAARATVVIGYEHTGVVVEVTDSGPDGSAAAAGPGGGHGLAGMRERLTVLGGELDAGPLPEGGFRVYARLPTRPHR